MRDILLALALLAFICLGFPAMKRVDRFLNKNVKPEDERPVKEEERAGK